MTEEPKPTNAAVFPRTPDRRQYRHIKCGHDTEITGNDFLRLANPFDVASATQCAQCGQMGGFGEFVWSDTGENLAAYRERLTKLPPLSPPRSMSTRFLIIIGSPLVIGGLLALVAGRSSDPDASAAVGLGLGALVGFFGGAGVVLMMNRANPIDYRGYR